MDTNLVERQIEALNADEIEQAFIALVHALDEACCVGVALVRDVEPEGITIALHLTVDRVRKWAAMRKEAP